MQAYYKRAMRNSSLLHKNLVTEFAGEEGVDAGEEGVNAGALRTEFFGVCLQEVDKR